MIVKLKARMAGPDGNFPEGHEMTVSDELGRALLAGKWAVEIKRAPAKPAEEKSIIESAAVEQSETAAFEPPRRRRGRPAGS